MSRCSEKTKNCNLTDWCDVAPKARAPSSAGCPASPGRSNSRCPSCVCWRRMILIRWPGFCELGSSIRTAEPRSLPRAPPVRRLQRRAVVRLRDEPGDPLQRGAASGRVHVLACPIVERRGVLARASPHPGHDQRGGLQVRLPPPRQFRGRPPSTIRRAALRLVQSIPSSLSAGPLKRNKWSACQNSPGRISKWVRSAG